MTFAVSEESSRDLTPGYIATIVVIVLVFVSVVTVAASSVIAFW